MTDLNKYSEYFDRDNDGLNIRTDFKKKIKELRGIDLSNVLRYFFSTDKKEKKEIEDSIGGYTWKDEAECGNTYVPRKIRQAVYLRDNYTCKFCGTKDNLSIDHIIPKSCGGKTTLNNCQTLCVDCNRRKGAK
jgi:hypothetical protein